jgi:periplasmic copper chaperone A
MTPGFTALLHGCAAACLVAVTLGAFAADPPDAGITLKTGWLRPAAAGMAEARVYVDIVSATDLVLVGATTPVARKVELVDVTLKGDQSESRVVAAMPVPGGKMTRLAYRGSHLRLVDINKDLANGTVVPVTLAFKSPDGKDVAARFEAKVRGMLLPQQMPAVVKQEAEPAAKDVAPGVKDAAPAMAK